MGNTWVLAARCLGATALRLCDGEERSGPFNCHDDVNEI